MDLTKKLTATAVAIACATAAVPATAEENDDGGGILVYEGDHSRVVIGGENHFSIERDSAEKMFAMDKPFEKPFGGKDSVPEELSEKLLEKPGAAIKDGIKSLF